MPRARPAPARPRRRTGTRTDGPAFASNGPSQYVAVTHSAQHPDTTSVPTSAGNVWAYDNLSEQLTVTPVQLPDGANYQVRIDVNGSFQGFADPRMGVRGLAGPRWPAGQPGLGEGHDHLRRLLAAGTGPQEPARAGA
jgi:hypothetical protein